jgi:RNA polymerase sigma-70 factor (ECF subfamily)
MARRLRGPAPQVGRSAEAKEAYQAAIAATQNSPERGYLSRKRGELVC